MRIILFLLISACSFLAHAQSDEQQIRDRAKLFSDYLMNGALENVVAMYTSDAKIFPKDRDILEGKDLAAYWNPENRKSNWKTIYHKLIPKEIKIWNDEAYDYGYYEGTSSNGEEQANWKGKYVVIWRKDEGQWKIYLDIWNRIKLDE